MSKKYDYDLDVFYREDALSYYLLGAYCTDGSVKIYRGRKDGQIGGAMVAISSLDKDWLNKIRDVVCKKSKVVPIKNSKCYRLTIYSLELARWLISKGCTQKKSLTLKFPKIPKKYVPDFIRGCIDGDGTIGIYKYLRYSTNKLTPNKTTPYTKVRCSLYSASKRFVREFERTLKEHRIQYTSFAQKPRRGLFIGDREIISKHTVYSTAMNGPNANAFLQWVYYPGHELSMPRKLRLSNKIVAMYDD